MTTEAPVFDSGNDSGNQAPPAAAATPKARSKRTLAGIYISTPDVLRSALEGEAASSKTSVAALVRDKLAGLYNITLPPTAARTRTKYASPEEKAAARKQTNASRAQLMRRLMGVHRLKMAAQAKGEVLNDDEAGVRWDALEAERLQKASAESKSDTAPTA